MTVCTNVLKTTDKEHKTVIGCVSVSNVFSTGSSLSSVLFWSCWAVCTVSPLKHRTLPALPVSPSRALLKGSTTKHREQGFNTVQCQKNLALTSREETTTRRELWYVSKNHTCTCSCTCTSVFTSRCCDPEFVSNGPKHHVMWITALIDVQTSARWP